MPIDIKLVNTKKNIQSKSIIEDTFKNTWLNSPKHEKYYTSDGIHLVPYSAWMMTKKFVRNVKKLNKKEVLK